MEKLTLQKEKAPNTVDAVGAFRTGQSGSKSTATAAQQKRIVEALRTGPKSTDQLRALGCYQVSARIHGLRHRHGYEIETALFDGYAADGYSHARMALYTLACEPDGKQPQ